LLPELQRSEPARLPGPMACAAGGRSVTTLAISDPAYARVAAFLYHEAELLDHGRFEEWLELLAAELQYRAPVPTTDGGINGYASAGHFFYDNRDSLELRVKRLRSGFAWAEDPPSRTCRLITNIRAELLADGHIRATSNFLVYRSRG